MKKILSIFCLLCLFALPLVLTACESPQEEAIEESEEVTIETTYEEGAIEVDETMGTDVHMGTDMDMDMDTDLDDDTDMEPPAE
jgi:uncharacterized protein YcfL